MATYKRAKLAFDALRSYGFKITPRSITSHSCSNNTLPRLGFQAAGARTIPRSPSPTCYGGPRRSYYTDRRNVVHFSPRGPRRWFENPRTVFVVVAAGGGFAVTVYLGNLETVPYTKRRHLVLLSKDLERRIGEAQFDQIKEAFKGKILPAIHPDSVRVRLIAQDIVDSLKRGLSKEEDRPWSDLGYANTRPEGYHGARAGETLRALTEEGAHHHHEEGRESWFREEEVLDDNWVQKSRKKGSEKGAKPETSHLEAFKWEVLVVDEPVVNAFCLPGGKIVVFTGLLKHFRSDPEVATVIGHEVGHAVARHVAEGITRNFWFAILQFILYQFIMPDIANVMSTLFLRLPFSRNMEIEADYIGVLLMASAGYDPRVAPLVFEKLGKLTGDSTLRDYLSTHPSGKKRAQLLARAQVMEEALSIYRESIAGRG